jgi:hypothetical protein
MKAPAGNGKTGLLHLTTKQTTLSQQLSSSPATRRQATTFYHTIYLPSIYVLPQYYYSEKRLDDAGKKSMPSIFAKAGYNRNTSRSLLYGPKITAEVDSSAGSGCKARAKSKTSLNIGEPTAKSAKCFAWQSPGTNTTLVQTLHSSNTHPSP